VGAGHGSFTDIVLDAGGTAVITEMSKPSVEFLKRRFSTTAGVKVQFDSDGGEPFRLGEKFDLILLISVVHHIPDYLGTIARLCDEVLRDGGSILTFQDPIWYPRQSRWSRLSSTGMYLAWRITQGEFKRGLKTRMRRLTGKFNKSEPSDMVEYHVVRQGIDDLALRELLVSRFQDVEIDRYFSTQSPTFQAIGSKYLPDNTFGIKGRCRKPAGGAENPGS
jgi:SAM-dependent methyltransferase